MKRSLRTLGFAGLAFFLLKGLAWIGVAALAMCGGRPSPLQ
ncbi:MAG: hypothetical protein U9Q74_11485 [Gemmatimonadota bacterium]|nr:hypothetical protein [Gemmatimonadota bacterium]